MGLSNDQIQFLLSKWTVDMLSANIISSTI